MKIREIVRTSLGVIVFPSKHIESASKSFQTPVLLALWTLIAIGNTLPYALIKSQANPMKELFWVIWLIALTLSVIQGLLILVRQ